MDFSVMTPLGEQLTFGEDSTFDLSEQGILVIHDTEGNEQLTLSPAGWAGITEELPAADPPGSQD